MANLKIAVGFVLRQEDSRLEGAVTTLPGDSGGPTRFGLASTSHPELIAQGYLDASKVDRDTALAIAEEVYEKTNANPMRVSDINDQALATACCPLPFLKGWLNRVEAWQSNAAHCVSGPIEWPMSVLAARVG